jgi:hypothetical protein
LCRRSVITIAPDMSCGISIVGHKNHHSPCSCCRKLLITSRSMRTRRRVFRLFKGQL